MTVKCQDDQWYQYLPYDLIMIVVRNLNTNWLPPFSTLRSRLSFRSTGLIAAPSVPAHVIACQVYPFGVPALFFFLLYRKVRIPLTLSCAPLCLLTHFLLAVLHGSQREVLRTPDVLQSLGFLFDAYSRPAYLFEVRFNAAFCAVHGLTVCMVCIVFALRSLRWRASCS
jgi:hypothetical protein